MDLTELRKDIDAIDRELVWLLEKRLDVAAAVAAYKKAHGLPVHDPAREAEKLSAVRDLCRPATAGAIGGVFESVIAACRGYENALMEAEHE